jgi:hypothetical protein
MTAADKSQERIIVTEAERMYYEKRLDDLAESIARIEDSVGRLAATVEGMSNVCGTLEGFATAWEKASGGIWVVKKVVLLLVWLGGSAAALGAGLAGYRQITEYFK